jgi:hypothetical protein
MGVSGWNPGLGNALRFQFRRARGFPGEHCAFFTARVIHQLTGGRVAPPPSPVPQPPGNTARKSDSLAANPRGLGQGIIGCPRFHTFYIFSPG